MAREPHAPATGLCSPQRTEGSYHYLWPAMSSDLPVPVESKFEKDQFMADFVLHRVVQLDNSSNSNGLGNRDQRAILDVEPDDANESSTEVQEGRPGCQMLGTSFAVSTTTATFPTMLATSVVGSYIRTEEIFPTGPDLAGGRPGAQPNYGSISVQGRSQEIISLGANKRGAEIEMPKASRGRGYPPPQPTRESGGASGFDAF